MPRKSPYELICDPDKTTITAPGGVALGFGPGPGLRNAIFWNRVGSLFSCYRPAVAVLHVFDVKDLHHPIALKTRSTRWEPNLACATYTAPGLRIEEERTALKAGLRAMFTLTNTTKKRREWVLFFHGQVEQWDFFDYQRGKPEPLIECSIDPQRRSVTLTQPHPHDGLPGVNSIQQVTLNSNFDACGFGQNAGDLECLWHDHGCLASLKMRLGQVGGRITVGRDSVSASRSRAAQTDRGHGDPRHQPITFSHRHPLYYFATRIVLKPGQTQIISTGTQYATDDPVPAIEQPLEGTTREDWRRYLSKEVPQLECDDEELRRYWYYVWYVLRANRTAPGAHVTHPFTAPSKYMYWGPWIWDGYFHVLGEMWK